MDIVREGNIYVNGYQVPYLTQNSRENCKELVVGGERVLWLEGGLGYQTWNFKHMQQDTKGAEEFSRFFAIPGLNHCGVGNGLDDVLYLNSISNCTA